MSNRGMAEPTATQAAIANALKRKLGRLGINPQDWQHSGHNKGPCPLYRAMDMDYRKVRRALNQGMMTWATAERLCNVVGWTIQDALADEQRWQWKLEQMREMRSVA